MSKSQTPIDYTKPIAGVILEKPAAFDDRVTFTHWEMTEIKAAFAALERDLATARAELSQAKALLIVRCEERDEHKAHWIASSARNAALKADNDRLAKEVALSKDYQTTLADYTKLRVEFSDLCAKLATARSNLEGAKRILVDMFGYQKTDCDCNFCAGAKLIDQVIATIGAKEEA